MSQSFPQMEVTRLSDQVLHLPQDTKGKYTLIGMSYSKKSEDDLVSWFNPVYRTFIYKPDKPGLFSNDYDVNVYFIAMFAGVNKAALGTVKKKMRKHSDPELEPHLLFYKGEIKSFKQSLNLDRKDTPYFFVLDESGQIVHTMSGAYSQEKMDAVEELLEDW
ncbi:MAG: hypothetical protein DHS20C17_11630 [Cyclobacteriaceae bacterium]|nr:MAG: hypothetical protein DHS20C17_11630 [Cyclobacteriaceae bacterium]